LLTNIGNLKITEDYSHKIKIIIKIIRTSCLLTGEIHTQQLAGSGVYDEFTLLQRTIFTKWRQQIF